LIISPFYKPKLLVASSTHVAFDVSAMPFGLGLANLGHAGERAIFPLWVI
jgi:hypothetical protein